MPQSTTGTLWIFTMVLTTMHQDWAATLVNTLYIFHDIFKEKLEIFSPIFKPEATHDNSNTIPTYIHIQINKETTIKFCVFLICLGGQGGLISYKAPD